VWTYPGRAEWVPDHSWSGHGVTRGGVEGATGGRACHGAEKLNVRQESHLVHLFEAGEHITAELADLFGVGRSTVYRAHQRSQANSSV